MNKDLWKSSTSNILVGVKLYYICSIVATAFSISFMSLLPVIGPLGKMAAGASVVGAFMFMFGLRDFKDAVNPEDFPHVKKLHTSLLLIVISIFLDLIPVIGFVVGPLVSLTAFIFMLLGYVKLKGSNTFPTLAKDGAKKLFIAMIIACVSSLLGIIPFAGGIIATILDIVVLVFVLQGWNLIAADQQA